MLHSFVYTNLEKLSRENKTSPPLKTPEKDSQCSGITTYKYQFLDTMALLV